MNSKYDLISSWLVENNIKTHKDYKISSKSWLKAGGIVKNFITPDSVADCKTILKFLSQNRTRDTVRKKYPHMITTLSSQSP